MADARYMGFEITVMVDRIDWQKVETEVDLFGRTTVLVPYRIEHNGKLVDADYARVTLGGQQEWQTPQN